MAFEHTISAANTHTAKTTLFNVLCQLFAQQALLIFYLLKMKSRSDKLRRCYYSMAKEIFDGRLNNASPACQSSKRWLYLRDISVLIYGLRLFVIKWLWENDFKGEELLGIDVLKYDVVCNYLNAHKDQLDPFFCVVLYLFGLFEFSCQHAYHSLNADTPTWRWWYELVVVNQDQYYEASLDNAKTEKIFRKREAEVMQKWTKERKYLWATLMPRFLVELLAKLQARIAIWTGLETVDKEKLFSKLFQVVPGLSPRIRTRVLLWLIAFDKICYFLQGGLAFLFFTVLVFAYTDGDYTLHPWYVIIWLLWEYLFTFLVALRMCRSAMFFTICTLLGTIVYTGHVIEVGRSVWTLIRENECNAVHEEKEEEEEAMMVGGKIPLTKHTVLYNELHEHNLVCFLVVDGCETLFGSVLLAFLLTVSVFGFFDDFVMVKDLIFCRTFLSTSTSSSEASLSRRPTSISSSSGW